MPARVTLSKEVIVARALAIADREGLEAVTTRRLAKEHSVSAMAMYGHFPSKNALLDGVAACVLGEVDIAEMAQGAGTTERLNQTLTAFLNVLREHPELATLVASRIVASDPGLRLTERTVSILREAGFTARDASESASFLLVAVTALASPSPGYRGVTDPGAREAIVRQRRSALGALDPAVYRAIVDSADELAACASHESYYSRGVALLVTGTVALVR